MKFCVYSRQAGGADIQLQCYWLETLCFPIELFQQKVFVFTPSANSAGKFEGLSENS